ncbi:transposase [Paraburkholderia sp. BL21I4N1]|uniref:transposase n=1 Tax=Paraburkholderia sp. BL21I4N1 TaxID=1938801 RepID=UPI000CFB2DCA
MLFYLPPYSPELNLIEIVWKHMKYLTGAASSSGRRKPSTPNSPNCYLAMASNSKSISREHLR